MILYNQFGKLVILEGHVDVFLASALFDSLGRSCVYFFEIASEPKVKLKTRVANRCQQKVSCSHLNMRTPKQGCRFAFKRGIVVKETC